MTQLSLNAGNASAATEQPSPSGKPSRRGHKLLVRGESMIGFVGIAAAAILLATIASAAWWSMRAQQDAWRFVRNEQIRTLASVLTPTAESMLSGDELSSLRRLLVEAKQQHDLSECRIVLPDGRIPADADPTKITLVALPAQWPSGPLDTADASAGSSDVIRVMQPLLVRGRGAAMLRIVAPTANAATRVWETTTGIGLIGAAGLAAMLVVYRHMRAKVMTLGLIRDSLLASQGDGGGVGAGSASRDALCLREDLGPEASAWNHLLAETETLRKTSVAERVRGSLGTPKESRGDLEHAIDALSVGMVIVNEQVRVKHANGAAAALLRVKRDQMNGELVAKLIGDAEVGAAIEEIVAGAGMRRSFEVRRTDDLGGGILRIHVRPMRRDDTGGALVTIEDVTQQRVADAARNSFVAQATHELRAPLTNMRLCLENALEDVDSDPSALRTHINTLNQETRRLERMVGEMLSVAQIEAGSLELKRDDVRLDKAFDELQADYKPHAADKKLSLAFELPPKLPVIQGDRDKLMVALHNLIGNAVKYTPSGGKVTVAVRSDTGARVVVDVIDTGIGIEADEQQRIFEKFYRAKDPRVGKITGTGLGLALAREIARLHGGDIAVQSELNKGSTFTLTLPAPTPAK
jgi:signal transduction histidine kinase